MLTAQRYKSGKSRRDGKLAGIIAEQEAVFVKRQPKSAALASANYGQRGRNRVNPTNHDASAPVGS